MILIKNRLNAGFFSNFNAVLGWYWYSIRTEIPIYINWDGLENQNIFDTFFYQKNEYSKHQYEFNANFQHSFLYTEQIKEAWKEDIGDEIYKKYNEGWFFCKGTLYTENEFHKLRRLYNFVYNEKLKLKPELNRIKIPPKTLGVNYRYIKMYSDFNQTPFEKLFTLEEYHENYLYQIEREFESNGFKYIYIASSHKSFFEKCRTKFKDKLLFIEMDRLEEHLWEIHRNVPLQKEYSDVLTDVIHLTKCESLLISPSNISFSTLILNPTINYKTFDFLINTFTG
jgi:hypothetical protein